MGQIICQHSGRYNIYSTISDGFIFSRSVDYDELADFIVNQATKQALEDLRNRVDRADKVGTSSWADKNLNETLCCNRAGPDEKHLTTKECIAQFLS